MNKYLITILVPNIEREFEVYIPNNKKVGTIKKIILKAITELSNYSFRKNIEDVRIIDRETGKEYENNIYIKDTQIKNGTKIVML